jgi:HEPN domain-containing protein
MAPFDEARLLLAAAHKDFLALTGMSDPSIFADEVFGFHAHQTAEKALKAWISLTGGEYPRTHDLSLLLNRLESLGQNVAHLYELIEYNPFAVQYRYEAFPETGPLLDRRAACERVTHLLETIRSMLT